MTFAAEPVTVGDVLLLVALTALSLFALVVLPALFSPRARANRAKLRARRRTVRALRRAGVSRPVAERLARNARALGRDLARFHGVSTDEAVEALRRAART